MKRFWLEEDRRWMGTMTPGTAQPAASRSFSGCSYMITKIITLLLVVQLITICAAAGQDCKIDELNQCLENEMCSKKNGVCECRPGFVETLDKKCEKPSPTPAPEPSASGVGLGLGVTFVILLLAAVVLVIMHRRFGLLSPLLSCLPNIRPFGSSGGSTHLQVVEGDDDDDVNPIA